MKKIKIDNVILNKYNCKPIILNGKETNYMATADGHIISKNYRKTGKPRFLKETINKDGYHNVKLYKNGKKKGYKVHRLIALAFIKNPKNKPEVNHKDGNKSNNDVTNLEWSTREENMVHAVKMKLHKSKYGEDHPESKYSNKQIEKVCKYLEDGKMTVKDISKKTGVHRSSILNVYHGNSHTDISQKYDFSNTDIKKISDKSQEKFTDKQIINVCKEIEKGTLLCDISEKTGVSYAVVKRIKAKKYKPKEHIYKNYDFSNYKSYGKSKRKKR